MFFFFKQETAYELRLSLVGSEMVIRDSVRAGKLRALAVTIERRLDALPDIPAIAEFVPGYEASGWFGVGAPKATPVEIIDQPNKEINASVAGPKMNESPGS